MDFNIRERERGEREREGERTARMLAIRTEGVMGRG